MEKSFWINRWETNDIPFHRDNVTPFLIKYFKTLSLSQGDCIFVPLCGKTKDMIWLAQQGLHVIGCEFSEIACRDFFAEHGVMPEIIEKDYVTVFKHDAITLLCGDFFKLTAADFPAVHAVYDCKAMIALPADQRRDYLHQHKACLGNQFKTLLLTRESPCMVEPPPYPISLEEISNLYGDNFVTQQLEYFQDDNIPQRLLDKGYTKLFHGVYCVRPV